MKRTKVGNRRKQENGNYNSTITNNEKIMFNVSYIISLRSVMRVAQSGDQKIKAQYIIIKATGKLK